MAFDFGAAGGGAAEGLEQVLRRLFMEAQQRQQAELARESMGVQRRGQDITARGQDLDAEASRGQLGLGRDRLGLDIDKFGQEKTEYAEGAPQRLATLKHTGAQTADLESRPGREQAGREHDIFMEGLSNKFTLGHIKARGDQGVREASVRAANAPPIRILTTDEQGNAVTKVMPRSEATGQSFAAAPTADMRNKQAGRKQVQSSISAVKGLGDQLITERGVAQRAKAAGMAVEAALGNHPRYRAYQDARLALAGNLAVAQQGSRPSDADIKSIWLPLVPDAFNDTDESAALKWGLINTMQNTGGQAPPTSGSGVKIKSIQEIK